MSEGGCDFLLIFAPAFFTHHEHLTISHMYLDTEKKKEFFDYIDKNYKSDAEKETGKEDPDADDEEKVARDKAKKKS